MGKKERKEETESGIGHSWPDSEMKNEKVLNQPQT